ncbi:hypothetical protein ACFUMH_06050 [Cellulomonas sp. NPDC057328]|uniref:hypothetical protein n=1 Tax=Cellulomonas sp. NPDC057328 TaxID=3346101 RepID=UPI00363DACBB
MTSAVPGGAHAPLGPEQCDRCAPRRTAAAGQHAAHVVLQLLNREARHRTHTAGANYFAGRTHLGATVAALIAHHDREQPDRVHAGDSVAVSLGLGADVSRDAAGVLQHGHDPVGSGG